MNDPLRETSQSFDAWYLSFEVRDKAERELISNSARTLLKNPAFNRTLNRIEAKALRALALCSLDDPEKVMGHKTVVAGIRSLRQEVKSLAEAHEYDAKRQKS